jgi:predicted metal-dependent hydrolase
MKLKKKQVVSSAQIIVEGIKVNITYKPNKHSYLRVRDGEIFVTAPFGTPKTATERFIRLNMTWINKKLRSSPKSEKETENITEGSHICLWGKPYKIKLIPSDAYSIAFDGETMTALLSVPPSDTEEERKEFLRKVYGEELSAALKTDLPRFEEITGLYSSGTAVKYLKSRWGSCSMKTRRLSFNLRLAQYPPECLRMIIVHELCHLSEPSHSRGFYILMDKFISDRRRCEKMLKSPPGGHDAGDIIGI